MKLTKLLFFLISTLLMFQTTILAQDEEPMMPEENGVCFKCHGHKYYSVHNENIERTERKLMNPYFVIDSTNYLSGEHSGLMCIDCHSGEYETYPHAAELKMEPKLTCVFCHEFEEIEQEAHKSVHFEAFGESFSCELCHDPHSNKIVKTDMEELVLYNNNRCLGCHNNTDKYQILTSNENPQVLETHDWLPNQTLHFTKVRCVECHTAVTDTSEFVHHIVPKEEAVRSCSECHSENSLLRDKLYKHQLKQERSELSLYKSFILNDAYVIGANRNYYVNLFSLLLFGCTLGGILLHVVLRIFKRK